MKSDPNDPAIWSDSHIINSFEVDPSNRATVQTLAKLMQESAWNHANALKMGYSHLLEKSLVWILSRLKIRIHDFPAWGESIQVRTWAVGAYRLKADPHRTPVSSYEHTDRAEPFRRRPGETPLSPRI